jgi:hypothetical protein
MKTSTLPAAAAAPSTPVIKLVPRANTSQERGVVRQVRLAFSRNNLLATCLGFLLGGFVPLASYVVAHYEVVASGSAKEILWALLSQKGTYLVLGGLAYSAKTVFAWGRAAFHDSWKAIGFVVLLEGVMVTSSTHWLALASLAMLVGINGTATGCGLLPRSQR